MLSKRTSATKLSEKDASESAAEEVANDSVVNDEKSNGETEGPEEISQDEPCNNSEELAETMERKILRKLKPPRVLEVLL